MFFAENRRSSELGKSCCAYWFKCSGLRKTAAAFFAVLTVLSVFFGSVLYPSLVFASDDDTPLTNLIEGWPQMSSIAEASGIVMDADTGAILYSLNRNTVRYPASTTKILTALLTIENASLSDTVTMTAEGIVHCSDGSTNAGTVAGEEFTVEQCLYIMLLKSANDIAVQLAVHVAGSVSAFAEMMNARAEKLGCTSSHFVNPSGMPDSEHYSCAEDMARIMRECMKNETFRKIVATPRYTVPPTNKKSEERVYDNHNLLIQPTSEYYYEPDIGGKTGFTQAAWRTFVTAAEKDGMTLIAVTMRGPDKTDFIDAKNLLEYGFNNFSHQDIDGVQVTLPNGFAADAVEQKETQLPDGTWHVECSYKGLPLGEAVLPANARGEEVVSSVEEVPVEAEKEQETGSAVVSRGGGIPTPVLIVVLIILLAAMAGVVTMLLRERR